MKRLLLVSCVASSLFLWFGTALASGQATTPTPTCAPDYIAARFEPDYGPVPTYYPGDRFPLRLTPVDLDDWPTTPSEVGWHSSIANSSFSTTDTFYTLVIPDPAPDTVEVYAWISVPDIRPECGYWSTHDVWFTARRFDYNPTPSPTPTVSMTPSPSPTPPCDPPCSCEPTPTGSCSDFIVYPKTGETDVPTTFILEHTGEGFYWMEEGFGGEVVTSIYQIGEKQFYVEGLKHDTLYYWYLAKFLDGCGDPVICFPHFRTVKAPPTPTPTPTPIPSPTATELPPTPTALPTPPPGANGWVVCQFIEKFI